MRVVCENCGATYKIPESKLTKEVNKATCRKCGFRMMIRRPAAAATVETSSAVTEDAEEAATQVTANPLEQQGSERELLEAETRIQKQIVEEWSDEAPTQVQADPLASESGTPRKGAQKSPASTANKAPGDMLLALGATFGAAAGPMLLATNTGDVAIQRMVGLLVGLWGALTCLFLLITGNLWRQQGNIPISVALATVLSLGGTAFVEVAMYESFSAPVTVQAPPAEPVVPVAPSPEEELAEDADSGTPAVADAAEIPEPTDEPSTEEVPPPEEPEELPPVDPEEDLDEPDMEEIPPTATTRSEAEERRRREMEDAAARAKADREARDAERARKDREAEAERKSSEPPKMKSLPLTVVDTMIRSNMSVKRCFFSEKEASGSLPARVNVRFTVMPTGRISSARVTTAEYKGSTLDSCLGRAFKAIVFPAFEGDPLSMTYPFIL